MSIQRMRRVPPDTASSLGEPEVVVALVEFLPTKAPAKIAEA